MKDKPTIIRLADGRQYEIYPVQECKTMLEAELLADELRTQKGHQTCIVTIEGTPLVYYK